MRALGARAAPPQSLSIQLQIGNPAQLPDVERARDAGLRVGHVSLLNCTGQPGEAWDRLCAAGAALAVNSLYLTGQPFSPDVVQRIDANTVRLLFLSARPGSFVALEARFKRGAGLALTVDVQRQSLFPEDDVAALERLLAFGTIASLSFKAGSGMDAIVWRRVFAAASTALRTVDMGRLRFDDALAIFSSATAAAAAAAVAGSPLLFHSFIHAHMAALLRFAGSFFRKRITPRPCPPVCSPSTGTSRRSAMLTCAARIPPTLRARSPCPSRQTRSKE